MNNIVLINCNDICVPKSIIALNLFIKYNPNYKKVIIGTLFSDESKKLCEQFNVILKEIDLIEDFYDLDKRPYGKQYPIECFYHFYAYKMFTEYDFIIQIEQDIYTNKKLDIDFNLIKYIGGGSTEYKYIKDFTPIMNDYEDIKNVYGEGETNKRRLLGGVRIYNIKELQKINFYEKIVDYYQTSLRIKKPRCGDDSLFVMYQILNPSHCYLFDEKFNVLFLKGSYLSSLTNFQDISFFHFSGSTRKYWLIKNSGTLLNIQRYFFDNMIEYIYNNYTSEFIKKYVPDIYVSVKNIKIPFYYYNSNNNFGDLITPYFLNKFCNKDTFEFDFSNKNPKIISCGSIMRLCDENTIVWGSGIRDIDQNINKGIIKSVRGPLTRERLLEIGCYCPPVYGDPGLILPLYYNPVIEKKYTLGIIPHHVHYEVVSKMYTGIEGIKVINLLNKDIELVINEILSCEKTISSSLHGLIISDAYNIPNKWVKFNDQINGDGTKFYDYFQSVKREDTDYIDCFNYKKIPEDTYNIIKDVNISYDINYIQEKFFMDKNGIKPYTKYLYRDLVLNSQNTWLALKSHWKIYNNKLTCKSETFLKKNTLHSNELDETLKIKISENKEVFYLNDFNQDYYLVYYSF